MDNIRREEVKMKKYVVALSILALIVLSGCEQTPENVSKDDMVTYRIVIKSVTCSSNVFTVNYMFNREDGYYLDIKSWFTADYEGTKSFSIADWIISPGPDLISKNGYLTFTMNEGETVPETIIFNTKKPIYLRKTVEYHGSLPGLEFEMDEEDITVAKAYFETAEIPVTIQDQE